MTAEEKIVTISGSYRKHWDRILAAKHTFEEMGWTVLRPHTEKIDDPDGQFVRLEGDPEDPRERQAAQLAAICKSALVYNVNPGGYVGTQSGGEAFFCEGLRRSGLIVPFFCQEQPFEQAIAYLAAGHGSPREAALYVESLKVG